MKNLVLVRIDDRLIHGQVVTQWLKTSHGNRILIVDEALPTNTMMTRVLKAAAPPGVTVHIMNEADAVTFLQQDAEKDENVVILVKVPQVLEGLLNSGVPMPKIILGGMGIHAGRKKLTRNVAASDEELQSMRRIMAQGTTIFYQLVPSDKAVNIDGLV